MSGPIIYISHFQVKQGKLENIRQIDLALSDQLKANNPGTFTFLSFLNEDATEHSHVHVCQDADAFDRLLEGFAERARVAFEYVVPTRRELYGTPSARALEILRPPEGSGITFTVMPQPMAGYLRVNEGM